MLHSYTQSIEHYKGYDLEIKMTCYDSNLRYHRSCLISKDGNQVAVSKTKKEAKDLMDHDAFKPFEVHSA